MSLSLQMRWLKSGVAAAALALAMPVLGQTVVGPIAGNPASFTLPDPDRFNYMVQEFFYSGQSSSYLPNAALAADGNWIVKEGDKAPFTSRVVVIRPKASARFNGTVLVEWLNVSGGGDAGVDWSVAHREILRSGYAYIGVSAQRVGIYGNGAGGSSAAANLKKADPMRYEKLEHPGDAFSYDIFSQAGKIVRTGKVLGPLQPRHVIAMGESQSAAYLTTYVNAVDPLVEVFDGFLIHSRSGSSAKLAPEMPAVPVPVKFRPSLRVPVLTIITETDLKNGYYRARVPDSNKLRVWEVAGTAHGDTYMTAIGPRDYGLLPITELAKGYVPSRNAAGQELAKPINAAPQHHYVVQAALDALNRWVATGRLPPKGALLDLSTGDVPTYELDMNGNAKGGVRSPWVEVPIAAYSGVNDVKEGFGRLFGSTETFDDATLQRLYPGGRAQYLKKFSTALNKAVREGFILKSDRAEIRDLAAATFPMN